MSIRTKRNSRRFIAAAAAVALAASTFATSSPLSAAPVVSEQTRIAGADRYATANGVAIAARGARTNITTIVLASGENFPDGLAASALAGALNAPMLLTPAASLPTSVLATLTTIKSTNTGLVNIVIVGGVSAVSADVAGQLTAAGYTVTRISGADRYGTANAVAAAARSNNSATIGTFGGYRTAFLASGTNFPDALAASGQAYKGKHPIFLTDGVTLTDETKAAITAAGVQQVVILGGTSAVSAEVATAVAGVTGVITSTRISGDNRYGTATALATTLGTAVSTYKSQAFLVSGTNFPDALVSAQLAGAASGGGAIIPVTSPLPAAVSTWVTANQSTLNSIRVIGGVSAVAADIVTAVKTGATTPLMTATIAALDGASTATITFSDTVKNVANSSVTVIAASGASKAVDTPTSLDVTEKIATVTLSSSGKFAPGDVISIVPSAIEHKTVTGLRPAAASFTVVANTTVPVATITAYPGTTGSATSKVWINFNVPVTGFDCAADLTFKGTAIGATAVSAFDTTATVVPGQAFTCNVAAGFSTVGVVVGGTVTLKAAAVSTSATTVVQNAATSVTVVADTVAPTLQSARYALSATGGDQASILIGGGNTLITARSATAVAGRAGNAWGIAIATDSAVPAVSVNSTTKVVTINAPAGVTSAALTIALNASAAFTALFQASDVTASAALGLVATTAAAPLTNGADVMTLTLTFSEALGVIATGDVTVSTNTPLFATVNNATITTANAAAAQVTGVVTATVKVRGAPLAGVTAVTLTSGITDRNGNAVVTTGTSHIVTMFAS